MFRQTVRSSLILTKVPLGDTICHSYSVFIGLGAQVLHPKIYLSEEMLMYDQMDAATLWQLKAAGSQSVWQPVAASQMEV